MKPAPGELETDPRFPSGKWAGFWTQKSLGPGKHSQEMLLTFRQGTLEGEGRDRVGKFHMRGFYSTEDGRCRWTKKYVGRHDVYYQGFNEGKGIWGTWEISSPVIGQQLKGGFHIWPEGMSDPTRPALSAEAELPVEKEAEVGEPVAAG